MLSVLARGMASLAQTNPLAPRRREDLPELPFPVSSPVVHLGNLDTALQFLRGQAWDSLAQIEREADAVEAARRRRVG